MVVFTHPSDETKSNEPEGFWLLLPLLLSSVLELLSVEYKSAAQKTLHSFSVAIGCVSHR